MPSECQLLQVELGVDYPAKRGTLRDVTFSLQCGEMLGLVGESGSGKSTISLALLGLLRWKGGRATGRVMFDGRDLLAASEKQWQQVRGRQIGLVLQSPTASLNPALRIGTQLREAWRAHDGGGKQVSEAAISQALLRVGLPYDDEFRRRYPSQISVGQAQRVLIAMAVMHSPQLLIADEPTSALDAVTQVEILDMLTTLNRGMGMAVLYISHDLQSVAAVCTRVAILEKGTIVEQGKTESVLRSPRHPYTQHLMSCAPWLQWWLEEPRTAELRSRRRDHECSLPVPPAPVQGYSGLKSPHQWPMG
jgi:ABC-type glutathione transport system ATPase component